MTVPVENTLATPLLDLNVQIERLKEDLRTLSEFGQDPKDHGLYRMAFTEADLEARRWLLEEMQSLGAATRIDGAGNVIGHWPPDKDGPAMIIGSHTDTVPCGGHLDGSLGVLIGLECLRVLVEADVRLNHPVEVVAFSDEEGRFGGMLGSQAFCGEVTPEFLLSATDLNGVRLADEMQARGFDPMGALEARREPSTIKGYLEVHIEQGPVLDETSQQVGVVDTITGLFRWNIRFLGKANHAGTTPMHMRQDAFLGLAEFADEIPRVLEENGSDRSRATIGNVELFPGSANTVPGQANFSLDCRDTSQEVLDELADAFRKALSAIARRRQLRFEFEEVSRIEPVPCASPIVATITEQAKRLDLKWEQMPSGAAHDAQIVAKIAPVGMIFVPSRGGQSHSPAEWTAWHDIEAGANLALHTMIQLADPQ